jgi:hypothetical protein
VLKFSQADRRSYIRTDRQPRKKNSLNEEIQLNEESSLSRATLTRFTAAFEPLLGGPTVGFETENYAPELTGK